MDLDPDQHRRDGEEYPGAQWLRGESPSEILARLLEARPLELDARLCARLEERAVLLEPERTYLRVLAHTARRAVFYRGDPPLERFLENCIDRGIDDLIDEDVESERSRAPIDGADPRFAAFARSIGAELESTRRICVVLNTQPDRLRRASYAVLIQRTPLASYAAEIGGSLDDVRALVRESLVRLSRAFGRQIDPKEFGL